MYAQMGESRVRRPGGVRLGAGRHMTYKEGADLPEHALRGELARLQSRKEKVALQYKREEAVIEALLFQILDSLGNYANLDTKESVHQELQKEIMRGLASNKKNDPEIEPIQEEDEVEVGADAEVQAKPKSKKQNEATKKKMAAQKLKEQKLREMMPKKKRPSYRALREKERSDRGHINKGSYVRLLEYYGQEQEPGRINFWMNVLYPTTREHSATICGIKKRLERFKNRVLMDTDPMEYGVDWFTQESKAASKYPNVVKFPQPRAPHFLPPLERAGSVASSSGSQSSRSSRDSIPVPDPPLSRERRGTAELRKEPISASEFIFGTRPRSQKSEPRSISSALLSFDGIEPTALTVVHDSDAPLVTPSPSIHAGTPLNTPSPDVRVSPETGVAKSILHSQAEPDVREKRTKKVSINAPPNLEDLEHGSELDFDNKSQISGHHGETREEADRRRRISYDISTLEKRKKSLTSKVDVKKQQEIENMKVELAKVMKLRAEGREDEIDYELYFERRRTLALLTDEDENLDLRSDEDILKAWEDVQSCKYIRGYEPPEMRGSSEENLGDFVFWKGDYQREESFVVRRKSKPHLDELDEDDENDEEPDDKLEIPV